MEPGSAGLAFHCGHRGPSGERDLTGTALSRGSSATRTARAVESRTTEQGNRVERIRDPHRRDQRQLDVLVNLVIPDAGS